MKYWSMLGQVVGIALAIFMLVGCSTGNRLTPFSTPISKPFTPIPIPPPTPTAKPVPTPIGSTGLPASGRWQANGGESGPFEFTVSSDSTAITEIHYHINNFTCASVNTSVNADMFGSWPISNGQFTLDTVPNHLLDITVAGTFDGTGRHATGTWKTVVFGQACPDTWTGYSAS